jgi:hypothetical protein
MAIQEDLNSTHELYKSWNDTHWCGAALYLDNIIQEAEAASEEGRRISKRMTALLDGLRGLRIKRNHPRQNAIHALVWILGWGVHWCATSLTLLQKPL